MLESQEGSDESNRRRNMWKRNGYIHGENRRGEMQRRGALLSLDAAMCNVRAVKLSWNHEGPRCHVKHEIAKS